MDPASCSNFDDFELVHLKPSWVVRFEEKVLEGKIEFELKAKKDVEKLLLDMSGLNLNKVTLDGDETTYEVEDQPMEIFGQQLTVHLGQKKRGDEFKVQIKFTTSHTATAAQWLDKNQTKDRLQPQVFTYSQPIAARSVMPCMDTPFVKCPITAKLSVPEYVVALMSAVQKGEAVKDPQNPGYMLYEFEQKIPIPSYLVAFIVGKFDSRDISDRIRVWAEPSLVDAAAYEFAESEKQLQTAEKILGDYVWGRCDMVVLPPSFPLGGMENPCMIFLTPSLIAGDRSLICLVAHEQIHAWFGNLVTNATWEHEWLNEGFTTYMERRIGALMYGEADRQFCGLQNWTSQLKVAVYEQFHPTHELTKLVQVHDRSTDPNKAFSNIYYEKGQVFLYYLERLFGIEEFDKYLRDYIQTFSRKSINSQDWKDHFMKFFAHKKEILDKIDFDLWMYSPGMPPIDPEYDDSFQKDCVEYCKLWVQAEDSKAQEIETDTFKSFTPYQKEEFFNLLRQDKALSIHKIQVLTNKLDLKNEHNCEIRHHWIRVCLKAHWDEIVPIAHNFLLKYGRMKLIRYVYRDLFDWAEQREKTEKLFKDNMPYMHPMAIRIIAFDMTEAGAA